MDNDLSTEYISNAIDELYSTLGVKEDISSSIIYENIRAGKLKEAIKLIAKQSMLPVDININTISNNYKEQYGKNKFKSVKIAKVKNSGTEGITAQVEIPINLPFYGSPSLINFPINVKISGDCIIQPSSFALVMAHELSHILLYSLNHNKKKNEFYTDLTALMLGFKKIFRDGRKLINKEEKLDLLNQTTITSYITSYGYLNDEQFDFAMQKIGLLIKNNLKLKNELLNRIDKSKNILYKYFLTYSRIKYYHKYLSVNHKNIHKSDMKKFQVFFQPGYFDKYILFLKYYRKEIINVDNIYNNMPQYKENKFNSYIDKIDNIIKDLRKRLDFINNDTKLLKKYVNIIVIIKSYFIKIKKDIDDITL